MKNSDSDGDGVVSMEITRKSGVDASPNYRSTNRSMLR